VRRACLLALLIGTAAVAQPSRPLIAIHDVDARAVNPLAREAFRAVYGRAAPVRRTYDGGEYDFEPIAAVALGGGRIALVSTGVFTEAAHASSGVNAVHYLVRERGRLRVVGRWFGLGAEGSHGRSANRWGATRALSRWPIVYTEGGGTWQGCTVAFATLTELRPAGPVDVASFPVGYSNAGMVEPRDAEDVEGAVTEAVPDRSFTVRYSGTRRLSETYVRVRDRYRLRGGGESRVPGC